ncbi:PP2C family protein-serine/threonine phosphatase [Serratia sp. NPDC087055]|uniref:PP2C family protein-serine/threonine phosphatase n=1 Tax=Serratia sp. NPDC087055 TaxID=3364516 RepID=UPI0038500AF6
MFSTDFFYCNQGSREEQLDRYIAVETGRCRVFMLADGYSSCSAKPHYVDWLTEQLSLLKDSGIDCDDICDEIVRLLQQTDCYPGKASLAFVVSDAANYRYTTLGDTRIYWPAENLRTEDHSIAQLTVESGRCIAEKIRFHPYRNKLTRHAGQGLKYLPDWESKPVSNNECILVCSDGFWSQLDDKDIFRITDNAGLTRLLDQVMTTPLADNLSVALLRSAPAL